MLSLEESVQRMENNLAKSMEELTRRVKRTERLALRKKKHARQLAEECAKMELRATEQFAEKEESVKMEL